MKKKWIFNNIDETTVNNICSKFKLSKYVATILFNRGLNNESEILKFLSYNNGDFYSPFLLDDAEKACEIIKEEIDNNSKIALFGDYDVDGITSVAILNEFFTKLLKYDNIICVLPDRDDGYGLNNDYIDDMIKQGVKLLITADSGICNHDEVNYAHSKGLKVIITDHHEVLESVPEADAVINPKKDESYPFKYLAGVGVAFKLIQAYIQQNNLDSNFLKTIIDLVALGTIADIVPVLDENRLIAKLGFDIMKKHRRAGINSIMKYVYGNDINSRTISFGIAPRINASGRIGNPHIAFKLLTTEDNEMADKLAKELDYQNVRRQEIEHKILEEAENLVEKDARNENVIVLSSNEWNLGVIGIVSSKLKDKYYRPTFLISYDRESGMGRGSARSVEGFHLVEIINGMSDLVESFGGHEFAAGFTIKKENIDKFHTRLYEVSKQKFSEGYPPSSINIDMFLEPGDINIRFYDDIYDKLYPFGEKNPFPVFGLKNLTVNSLTLFNQKHASFWLTDGINNLKAVYYNYVSNGNSDLKINKGDNIDVVFTMKLSYLKGESFLELQLLDIYSEKNENSNDVCTKDEFEKWKERGNEYFFSGSFDRAIEFYFKALKIAGSDPRVNFNIGLAYLKKGDKGKAIYYYNKALKFSKNNDDEVYNKAFTGLKKIKNAG